MATNFTPPAPQVNNNFVVSDLLYEAARLANALKNPGTGISGSESVEFLNVCNHMLDAWRMDDLLIEWWLRSVVNVVNGQRDYGVGPNQDWDLARTPTKIPRAGFIIGNYPNEAEVPMRVLISYEEYADFVVKDTGSSVPLALYYVGAFPYGQATLWPVPNADSTIAIYTPQYQSEFSTIDDQVIAPDGYRELIIYNLAVRIHSRPPYNKSPMDAWVAVQAEASLRRVKSHQLQPMFIGADPASMQESYRRQSAGGQPKLWTPGV